jgi:hypothetical protein
VQPSEAIADRYPLWTRAALATCLLLLNAVASFAQLPSEPVTLFDGRLVVSGELRFTIAPLDEGYFNASDYNHNLLRLLTIGLLAEGRVSDRISVLANVEDRTAVGRLEGGGDRHVLLPYALFVRVRPWTNLALDIDAGRIPRVFGAFATGDYSASNPLIGRPLAYHYLLALRDDSLPGSTMDLFPNQGRGWRVSYPIGDERPGAGVPVVASTRLDTGIQMRWRSRWLDMRAALTRGTLSHPLARDNNDGNQLAGRIAVTPTPALILGLSAARGTFVDDAAIESLPAELRQETFAQRALGLDAEWSWSRFLFRTETILSSWDLPAVAAPRIDRPLRALSLMGEGRVKITPRVYAAARVDGLRFSNVADGAGLFRPWEAAITRLEVGGGFRLHRNATVKLVYQHNWRDTPRLDRARFVAMELSYWF